jgi:hypothetical protein
MQNKKATITLLVLSLLISACGALSFGTSQTDTFVMSITLNTPVDNATFTGNDSIAIPFNYTAIENYTAVPFSPSFTRASLFFNDSTIATVTNTTLIVNNTAGNQFNYLNYTFTGNATSTWHIELTNGTNTVSSPTYNFTTTVYVEPVATPTPTASPTPSPTPTPTPSPTPTATPVPTPTPTPEPPPGLDTTTVAIIAIVIIAIIVAAGVILLRRKPSP